MLTPPTVLLQGGRGPRKGLRGFLHACFFFTARPPRSTNMGSMFTLALIGSWYLSNIGVVILNKQLLTAYGFRFPIFLTLLHMVACSVLSFLCIDGLRLVPRQQLKDLMHLGKVSAQGRGRQQGGMALALELINRLDVYRSLATYSQTHSLVGEQALACKCSVM